MKIIFWNFNTRNTDALKSLSSEHSPDILFIAECKLSHAEILVSLNSGGHSYIYSPDLVCEKVMTFSKFEESMILPKMGDRRFTIRGVNVPDYPSFNLMALHYPSKLYYESRDQSAEAPLLSQTIRNFENQSDFRDNTIVIGDFNMNPFEDGMIQVSGMNAVMSKSVALLGSRKVNGKEHPMFYNPMWSFFGDRGRGRVLGTYFYNSSTHINFYWNMYDQILIRPRMIEYVDEFTIDIITSLDGGDMLTSGKLPRIDRNYSDHLPVCFTVKKKM